MGITTGLVEGFERQQRFVSDTDPETHCDHGVRLSRWCFDCPQPCVDCTGYQLRLGERVSVSITDEVGTVVGLSLDDTISVRVSRPVDGQWKSVDVTVSSRLTRRL